MTAPIMYCKKFQHVLNAINAGERHTAAVLLEDINAPDLGAAATRLHQYLRMQLAEPEAPAAQQSAVCGIYHCYPDLTARRTAEGGQRTSNLPRSAHRNRPLVTVITVVFNNAKTVRRCILSVLQQHYENLEYIIVDGGSTDGTVDVITEYERFIDYYVSEPDQGIYDAMNKGLSLASGEYIAFLNADDFYFRDAISSSISHIEKNGLDLSCAGFYYVNEDGVAVIADEPRPWNQSMLIQGIPGGHETIVAHWKCYENVGPYDTDFRLAADYDWVMRAFENGCRSLPLNKIILTMSLGGASFDDGTERKENNALLVKKFGDLGQGWLDFLYSLKFYKNWNGFSIQDRVLIERLEQAAHFSGRLHKALLETIDNRKKSATGAISPARKTAPDKLEICIALTFLKNASGGAERIAIEAANQIHREGHAVTVVACHGLAAEPYYTLDEEIPFIDLAVEPYQSQYLRGQEEFTASLAEWSGRTFCELAFSPAEADFAEWNGGRHLWMTRLYRGFLSAHDFDVVISHMPSTFPYTLIGKPEGRRAIHVASLHNAPSFKFYSPLYPADNQMDRYMRLVSLERADLIGVLFDQYVEQMPAVYQDKCFVLPNFISPDLPVGARISGRERVIVSVGRLAQQKDHATLLKAYARVKGVHPEWSLRIYGEGPLVGELRTLCEELQLGFDEIFLGAEKDISRVYEIAGIFAFPSIFEGFPLTLTEAMHFGLPVVAFDDCEGVKYLVRSEENGLLCARANAAESMAREIIRLIEDEKLRARLGGNAQFSADKYSLSKHIATLYGAIKPDELIGARRGCSVGARPAKSISAAIVSTYLEGGAGIAAKRLHQALTRLGIESRAVSFSKVADGTHYRVELPQDMQEIHSACMALSSEAHSRKGATFFSSSYPSCSFGQLSWLQHFDVINIHWVETLLSSEAVAYLARLGKPLVWTLHDMKPFTGGCHYSDGCFKFTIDCSQCPQMIGGFDDYPRDVLAAKLQHWGDDIVVVTPSRWLAERARQSATFRNNPIKVIPNSIDTDVFRPESRCTARAMLELPIDKKILLFTCQSHGERRKGFKELVQLAEFLASLGQADDYQVLTFGNAAPELDEIALPYTALGHIGDETMLALGYSAADVTILPTWEDNLPNIILESIACGTPVVAFDSGGVGDAVVDDISGYLVAPGDIAELASRVRRACSVDLRATCRNYAVRHYSQNVQARRYYELYEELVERPWPRWEQNFAPRKIFASMERSFDRLIKGA